MDAAPQDVQQLMADFEALKADIAFVRALRNLKISTDNGDVALRIDEATGNIALDLRALTPTSTPLPSVIPPQSGNTGKLLTTDGANPSWV